MQPYFLPYIGYWQMMQAVDEFVVYDDVQFIRGWINRNRMLWNGDADMFTLPLLKGSNRANINERFLTDAWQEARKGLLDRFAHAYSKAPHFGQTMALIEDVLSPGSANLADFLFASLVRLRDALGLETKLLRSSDLSEGQGQGLRGAARIKALAKSRGASVYINAPGGRELYDVAEFKTEGMDLKFLQPGEIKYTQFKNDFVPWLSIVDVMMFNDIAAVRSMLGEYTLD